MAMCPRHCFQSSQIKLDVLETFPTSSQTNESDIKPQLFTMTQVQRLIDAATRQVIQPRKEFLTGLQINRLYDCLTEEVHVTF